MSRQNDDNTLLSAAFGQPEDSTLFKSHPAPAVSSDLTRRQLPLESMISVMTSASSATSERNITNERFIEREVIGRGGMSLVVRAFDTLLERDVALKRLPPEAAGSEDDVLRLTEEARITGRLDHPYILPVYDLGTDESGDQFLCMKLVKGETLEETLARAGSARLEPEFLADLLQVFVKVCDAVAFAHSKGVLHRDLKPSNVMISDFGQVHVVDWGVARPTPPSADEISSGARSIPRSDPIGLVVGTPRYMAPEQLQGLHDRIDERADVFALGATLYQILTGSPPHTPDSLRDIASRKTRVTIPPPEELAGSTLVPPELSRIAMKAMSHDVEHRYASVDALKRDVERFQRSTWHLPRVQFSAGSVVIEEGERGDSAFVIVEGRCAAVEGGTPGEVVLREMGPGDVFGETAVFSDRPRAVSVRALTDVVLLAVTGEVLRNGMGLNHWLGSFVRALAERFRELDERIRQLELRTRPTQRPPRGA